MSGYNLFTKSLYDDCNLLKKKQESEGPYNWITDNGVKNEGCFNNNSPFMPNNFNNVPQNLIDIESDMRNQTRQRSRCINDKYTPSNNYNCLKCNKGVFCTCQTENVLKTTCSKFLTPDYTRKLKSVNLSGITINRFNILDEDLQDLNKIHDNSFIGTNTRLLIKDNFTNKL